MSAPYSIAIPGIQKLQDAATTGNGGILMLGGAQARVTVILQSNGTTSGGTVTIEEAYWDPKTDPVYAGTWSAIQAVNASTFTGGAQLVLHVMASCPSVRVRISSNITGGGSVTVWGYGN